MIEQLKAETFPAWSPLPELIRQDNAFIGRKDLLAALYSKLTLSVSDNNNLAEIDSVAITACHGLGGVGKTQLALRYFRENKNQYLLRVWFPAENLELLKQYYLQFAQDLGYRDKKLSFEGAWGFLKMWFAKNPRWLMVYDNVTSYEAIRPFLPEGPKILITTRYQEWPSQIDVLPIDVMKEEEAILLVQNLTQRKDAEITKLVKFLGFLPLALTQASAYIVHRKTSVAQYLQDYKLYEKELLSYERLLGTNHEPTSITWGMSIKAIQAEAQTLKLSPLAPLLLLPCAYLAPEGIPRSLLVAWFKKVFPELQKPEHLCQEYLGQLHAYSLITLTDNTLSIHRLVQSSLRIHHQAGTLKELCKDPIFTTVSK